MSRKPSAETELRHARSNLAKLRKDYSALKATSVYHCARAMKAEQEISEWKARFDALLNRPFQATASETVCNCAQHKLGETTSGWYCPFHGQQP
jgi:phage shock protein A